LSKLEEAREILKSLGLPQAQQNEISALTLLALCGIKPRGRWSEAVGKSLTISKDIMTFVRKFYGRKYAPNTRETFRRQVLHQFVQAGIADYNPDDPQLPTNSPHAHYAISHFALETVRAYGADKWDVAQKAFVSQKGTLLAVYSNKRAKSMTPVRLPDGKALRLSPGKHNKLQATIIEEFAPRFAPGARILYIGDTAKKNLHIDAGELVKLGIAINEHDKLTDMVIFDKKRNWLFLVEAVTSHGPMSPKRVVELKALFSKCSVGIIFVSAFPDFAEFRKNIKSIAWETEVWIAEIPDHLIHYNGDRFLGPH